MKNWGNLSILNWQIALSNYSLINNKLFKIMIMEENNTQTDFSSATINSNIDIHSEIGELLSNKYFLKYFKEYINIYLKNIKNLPLDSETKEITIKNFESHFSFLLNINLKELNKAKGKEKIKMDIKQFISSLIEFFKSKENFLWFFHYLKELNKGKGEEKIDVEQFIFSLIEFFESKNNLVWFLDYMWTKPFLNKDKYRLEYNKFLRVGDYLFTRMDKYNWLPKEDLENLLKEDLKKKVWDVLSNKTEDISFKLAEAWYPLMVEGNIIVDADFKKTFVIGGKKLIQVKFKDKNNILQKAYIDNTWKVYKSYNGLVIEQIDYSFTVNWINFFKFRDSNNNRILSAIKTSNNRYIELEFDDVRRKELVHNWEVLEYILTSSNIVDKEALIHNYNRLYEVDDWEIEGLQLMDILNFINPLDAYSFLEKKEYYNKFFLSEIKEPKIIDEITFLELTVLNKDWDKNNIVLTSTWDILLNWKKYVSKIYDLENFLGHNFLWFWRKKWFINWYLDKKFNPIQIPYDKIIKNDKSEIKKSNEDLKKESLEKLKNNKENAKFDIDIEKINKVEITKAFDLKKKVDTDNIFSIKKLGTPYKWEEYYILNNDERLVISEKNLEEHFSTYEAFSDVIENVKIVLEKDVLNIDWKEIIKLHVNFTYEWQIKFFTPGERKILDWNKVVDELQKTEKWQEIVKSLFVKLWEIKAMIWK